MATALATALSVAVGAGITTFFSPCAYPLLPGYVAFYTSQTSDTGTSLRGALSRGLAAAIGAVGTIAVLSAIAFWVGYTVISQLLVLEWVVGLALIGVGMLIVLDRLPTATVQLPKRRSSVGGFAIFGAGYAIAAVGCLAPVFVTVIATALAVSTSGSVLVIATYATTVAVLMLATTVAVGMGIVARDGRLIPAGRIKQLAGVVMIAAGIGQLVVAGVFSSSV